MRMKAKNSLMDNMAAVILVTGHPATGKTTLAQFLAEELGLPLIWKDQIKESLLDTLGVSTPKWSRQLSSASWKILYQQVENLLKANVSHIVESNFDPKYANGHWQRLSQKYAFQVIQVRCETDADVLLERYQSRIRDGKRHLGHVDASTDEVFLKSTERNMEWVEINGERLSFDTSEFIDENKMMLLQDLRARLF